MNILIDWLTDSSILMAFYGYIVPKGKETAFIVGSYLNFLCCCF